MDLIVIFNNTKRCVPVVLMLRGIMKVTCMMWFTKQYVWWRVSKATKIDSHRNKDPLNYVKMNHYPTEFL